MRGVTKHPSISVGLNHQKKELVKAIQENDSKLWKVITFFKADFQSMTCVYNYAKRVWVDI